MRRVVLLLFFFYIILVSSCLGQSKSHINLEFGVKPYFGIGNYKYQIGKNAVSQNNKNKCIWPYLKIGFGRKFKYGMELNINTIEGSILASPNIFIEYSPNHDSPFFCAELKLGYGLGKITVPDLTEKLQVGVALGIGAGLVYPVTQSIYLKSIVGWEVNTAYTNYNTSQGTVKLEDTFASFNFLIVKFGGLFYF